MQVNGDSLRARWVFDSTGWPACQRTGRHPLSLCFRRWAVTAGRAAFNPAAVTFLDTATAQPGELALIATLPASAFLRELPRWAAGRLGAAAR